MSTPHSIWHEGEKRLHRELDIEEKMQSRGQRVVRDYMPDQHRDFFAQLRFVVLSAVDAEGRIWPFLRTGTPGFMSSPDPRHLNITSASLPGEPADLRLHKGAKISVLGIEVETKRRNRMNGTVRQVDGHTLQIEVDQSFGNCPRYIHIREACAMNPAQAGKVTETKAFQAKDVTQITSADMLFIASRAPDLTDDPRAGVDVNHRGGLPGFVKVLSDRTLVVPDYDGNNFFNAFGNILQDPRCGLLFPDFASGDVLALQGHAEVVMNDPAGRTAYGSERYLRFETETVRRTAYVIPLRYQLVENSQNPPEPPGEAK